MMVITDNAWGRVERITAAGGLERLVLTHGQCTAEISLYGGQVLQWQPVNQAPVFWLSKHSFFEKGQAIRGGIPICWPWFGSMASAENHGFARLADWSVAEVVITAERIQVKLLLEGAGLSTAWPHNFKLIQTLIFGEAFEQIFEVVNLTDQPVSFTGALHSYFNVSSPQNAEVPALAGVTYQDKLQNFKECNLDAPARFDQAIDRIYQNAGAVDLYDTGLQRKISISKTHSAQWVVWNPGLQAAAQIKDIHPGGEQEYVCVEVANTDAIKVAANSAFTFSQRITLDSIG